MLCDVLLKPDHTFAGEKGSQLDLDGAGLVIFVAACFYFKAPSVLVLLVGHIQTVHIAHQYFVTTQELQQTVAACAQEVGYFKRVEQLVRIG